MKESRLNIAIGALLCVATSTYGQVSTNGSAVTNVPSSSTNAPIGQTAAPAKKPFISLEGTDVTVGKLPPITFHGFASQGFLDTTSYNYLAGDTKGGSFEYSEFGLNASVSPFDRTRIAAQAFMFDVGNVGNYEPTLDYALVDYTFSDQFGIRAGRIRRPEGIYNHIQDVDLARTSVLLPQGVYNSRWRDFSASLDGASIYGNLGLSKAGSLSYEVYGGMINLAQDGGVARQVENSLLGSGLTLEEVKSNPQVGGQLWWNTPVNGLRLGASLTENIGFSFDAAEQTHYPVGGGQFTPLEVTRHSRFDVPWQHYSVEYQHNKWTLQSEFRTQTLIEKDTTTVTFPQIPSHDSSSISRSLSTSASWYAGPAYEVNSWFQVGAYYNEYYADISQLRGPPSTYQKDVALSLRFDPEPWWIIKLEGHYIHGTGLLYDTEQNPNQSGNGWFMLAVKTTFSF